MNSHQLIRLSVADMRCAGCISKVEAAANAVDGVHNASVSLVDHTAVIEFEGDAGETTAALIAAIAETGRVARVINPETDLDQLTIDQQQQSAADFRQHMRHAAIATGSGFGLMAGSMSGWLPELAGHQLFWLIIGLITLAIMILSGRDYYRGMITSLRHKSGTMDTLVGLGTAAAWLYSMVLVIAPDLIAASARHLYFEAGLIILGLIHLGQGLETRARGKTGEAIRLLIGLQPKRARLVRGEEEIDIPITQVQAGDLLRVRPGEKVPVDGMVESGNSRIDESMISGEPVPVAKHQGDKLLAGTINGEGSLLIRAEQVGSDTMLAHIISAVRKAQASKPAIARLADRIAAIFVTVIIAIALLTFTIWWLFGPEPSAVYAFTTMMSVLLIACPCALGLATPISIMVGIGRGATAGILIRNAEALELMEKVDTVVVDKTGTLTLGKPALTSIGPAAGYDEHTLLQLAMSAELGSEHPLAAAIISAARARGIDSLGSEAFTTIAGHGVSATVAGRNVRLGNAKLMQQAGINTDRSELTTSAEATAVWIAVDDKLAGLLGVSDPVKPTSAAAVAALKAEGVEVIMLTGDREETAFAIAGQLAIDHVEAGLLPEQKAAVIARLQSQGRCVAMAGDGINDAPALAVADVGIAMGSGTDIAMESAGITLVHGDLSAILRAVRLSRATMRNIRQNLFFAFIYNSAGVPIAAGILYPFTGMLLSPMIAAAAMSFSSLSVVSNALRLRRNRL